LPRPVPARLSAGASWLALLLCLGFAGFAGPAHATTIWTGPDLDFVKPNFGAQMDTLTSNVRIARAETSGIYNDVTESAYAFGLSPADTEWAWRLGGKNGGVADVGMTAANFANLEFSDWRTAHGANPLDSLDLPGVLHLISDDVYLDIVFTSWTCAPGPRGSDPRCAGLAGGGFAYTRSTPSLPEPAAGALLGLGVAGLLVTRSR